MVHSFWGTKKDIKTRSFRWTNIIHIVDVDLGHVNGTLGKTSQTFEDLR